MHAVASMVVQSSDVALRCARLDALALLARCQGVMRIAGQHNIVSLAKLRIGGRIASREKPELVAGKSRRDGCSSSDDGRSRQ
jgi:hypothetical protein